MKTVAQTVIEADRFYTIAAHTGNVIQAVEASKDGGTVRLGKYDHKPEQEWSFVRVGDGVYRIRNRATGKLLDLTMTGTANGTWLHLWEDVGGTSQMWELCPTQAPHHQKGRCGTGCDRPARCRKGRRAEDGARRKGGSSREARQGSPQDHCPEEGCTQGRSRRRSCRPGRKAQAHP